MNGSFEETTVAEYRIVFFLEDAAQESLIPNLFRRLIVEAGLDPACFRQDVLYGRGGQSLKALRNFVEDSRKHKHLNADLLVVGSDANCKGFTSRRDWVAKKTLKSVYRDVVCAIPDPHIERWYMLDMAALGAAADVQVQGAAPAYKCDKDHYKKLLRDAFQGSGIEPPLGGSEFGPSLAQKMDLYAAGKQDHGLAAFLDGARSWLKRVKQAS
jgi:hypothetical protein